MPIANNQEVQNFSDQIIRPRCETMRNLLIDIQNDAVEITDVYANVTASNPPTSWTDSNSSGPPHLLQPSDVVAYNTVIVNLATVLSGATTDAPTALAMVQAIQGQWPVVLKAPVRSPV